MIHRCPSCGYEPVDQSLICPNCGAEIVENITKKLQHEEETLQMDLSSGENEVDDSTVEVLTFADTDEVNDDIVWSDLQEQPIGEVMKELAKEHDVPLSEDDLAALDTTLPEESQDNKPEDNQATQLSDFVQEQQEKQKKVEDVTLEVNPILANYIEMHNGQKEMDKDDNISSSEVQNKVQGDEVIDTEDEINYSSDTEKTLKVIENEVTEAEKSVYSTTSNHISQDSSDITQEDEEQVKPSKKWGNLVLAGAALLVVGGGFYYAYVQRQDANQSKVTQQINSELNKLSSKVDKLFISKEAKLLKTSVTIAQIDDLSNQLKKYKHEKGYTKISQQLTSAKKQLQKVSEVNNYFTSPIIENGQINKQATLDYSQKFTVEAIANPKEPYEKLVNEAVTIGQKSYDQYEKAQSATKELMDGYKNQLLASSVTREKYQNAKDLVDQLAKSQQKEELSKQLAMIDQALSKKEQDEKQVIVDNTETATQTEVVESNPVNTQPIYTTRSSEQSEVLSPKSVHQGDNQPLISSRLSDLQDVDNQAWQWAPEVENQVLQACLSRGYIVDGGYVLERARIENQEGYYNLYAVAPSPRFSYASANNPVYVVTINDKTGFYKGNGNDHTIR